MWKNFVIFVIFDTYDVVCNWFITLLPPIVLDNLFGMIQLWSSQSFISRIWMKLALDGGCTREKISETLIQQLQSLLYYNNKDWDNLKIGWTSWSGKRHIPRNSCKSNKHILVYHCRRKFIQLITDGYLKKSFS